MDICSVDMDGGYYRINVACDTKEVEFIHWHSYLCWCGPLYLAFPHNVAYVYTNIQQVA